MLDQVGSRLHRREPAKGKPMTSQNSSLVNKDTLNYGALLERYPWLIQRDQQAIISSDVDGILCALLMSHYFNWKVVGFYDGRDIAVKQRVDPKTCIFLDMDIFRKDVRSCGHHLVLYDKNQMPANWDNYSNCISPNIIRNFRSPSKSKNRYPFGAIHFLLSIFGSLGLIKNNLSEKAIPILLYVHGTVKNLFKYPENCNTWFRFLNVKNSASLAYPIFTKFMNITMAELLLNLKDVIHSFNQIGGRKMFGGDKIKIFDIKNNLLQKQSMEQIKKFICLLAQNTGWNYVPQKWSWSNFRLSNFSAGIQ